MDLEVTPEAAEVLKRSLDLARLDPASAGIRLRGAKALGGGFDVQVELAETALGDERTVEAAGLRLFVDPQVEAEFPNPLVTLEPQHEVVVVRSRGPS